jgi:PAS domain S-box-containing protein
MNTSIDTSFGVDADLQRLAEMALDPLGILTREFDFVWGNRAMRAALLEDPDAGISGNFLDFVHPEDAQFAELIASKARRGEAAHNCVVRVRVSGGYSAWEISVVPDGIRLNLSCRDVTQRNEQEQQLVARVDLLRMAERHAGLGHWLVDLVNETVYWSDTTYAIHGRDRSYTPNVAEGIDAYHPEDRARVAEIFNGAIEARSGFEFHARLVQVDGTVLHVLSRGQVQTNDRGEAISVFGIFQDITEQQHAARRQEQANRLASLGTLASGIAHEVNNPLAFTAANLEYIRSVLDRMAKGEMTAEDALEVVEACDDALEGAERVAMIIGKLRTFSAADCESASDVDLVQVLRRAVQGSSGADDLIEMASSVSSVVIPGDPLILQSVFEELINNAVVAVADAGTPRIAVILDRSGDDVVVRIEDNGVGIAEEKLDRIFDPFFTSRDVDQGRGLGLSTCLGIINSLGGSIDVASQLGLGTTVTVRFRATERTTEPVADSSPSQSTKKPTLFIVDDEPLVGRAIGRVLGREYDVVFFDSATDALDAIQSGHIPHALLSDVTMPGMNGIEFYRAVETGFPDLSSRFAFLTGGALMPSIEALLKRTNAPCVMKPFAPDDLRDALGPLIDAAS